MGVCVFLAGQVLTPLRQRLWTQPAVTEQATGSESATSPQPGPDIIPGNVTSQPPSAVTTAFRYYRILELQRVVASLKANAPILIIGGEGSGKSVLAKAVVAQLKDEGFTVADIEPATPKHMLTEIAEQLDVETRNLEGKVISMEDLKWAIAQYFRENTAFLVVDDAHKCDAKFRDWLKALKRQGVPMLLLATNPPMSDVFFNLPRIGLSPLPEYAIREVMEQAALERGIHLKPHELAKLQQRTGGNPLLAKRVIDEEYLGLDIEAGDHHRYFDGTPVILLLGIVFMASRFLARGLNDPTLYAISGVASAIFIGLSRLSYSLPKESKRIQN